VTGTLSSSSSRRFFRLRVVEPQNRAAVLFYARCDGPECSGRAYAVLTGDPRSVAAARPLRSSGGWTRLTHYEASIRQGRSLYLVVGCLDGCRKPVHFKGHAYAWASER
jgi:hypothetical protein